MAPANMATQIVLLVASLRTIRTDKILFARVNNDVFGKFAFGETFVTIRTFVISAKKTKNNQHFVYYDKIFTVYLYFL